MVTDNTQTIIYVIDCPLDDPHCCRICGDNISNENVEIREHIIDQIQV
jgi:hypothetical protein